MSTLLDMHAVYIFNYFCLYLPPKKKKLINKKNALKK